MHENFFKAVQEACLPAVWTRGIRIAREEKIYLESKKEESEFIFKILVSGQAVSSRVSLWPQDEDWFCDCGDRNDPCHHIAAATLSLKSKNYITEERQATSDPAPSVRYRLKRSQGFLIIERFLGDKEKEAPITSSLTSLAGGLQSGRLSFKQTPLFTKADFALDHLLKGAFSTQPTTELFHRMLGHLSECPDIYLEDLKISVSQQRYSPYVSIEPEGSGFRIKLVRDTLLSEAFKNGVALFSHTLRPTELPRLGEEEVKWITGEGTLYEDDRVEHLLLNVLPRLRNKIEVKNSADHLPELLECEPQIQLIVSTPQEGELAIIPQMIYGNPLLGYVEEDRLIQLHPRSKTILKRDLGTERALSQKLRSDLNLQLNRVVRFQDQDAIRIASKLKDSTWKVITDQADSLLIQEDLVPQLDLSEEAEFELSFEVSFKLPGGYAKTKSTDLKKVLNAWQEGSSLVSLTEGGWARLPKNWLDQYGKQIINLLAARGFDSKKLPPSRVPDALRIMNSLSLPVPKAFEEIKKVDHDFRTAASYSLPADLAVELRHYQQEGVNWLGFLKQHQLGGLLADDMGLGKTVQTLCVLEKKSLIVAPTSVLSSWQDQAKRFRPRLKISLYHGPQRKLDSKADLVLTTYAILRLDQEILCNEKWNVAVLDEAQTIKNPESQVAQAAHNLQARFKLALSGTPIENNLTDLWSQFQFLNPGFFGGKEEFDQHYRLPINRGQTQAVHELKARVKPFILRRMKKDVASELPPKTQTVIDCELSEAERTLYDSVWLATRTEVLEKLQKGESLFSALEILLRLRQACCHPSLVPGSTAEISTKISTLLEILETSLASGHKTLIFSQWTRFLDLIEPHFLQKDLRYLRLDGQTQNRGEIIDAFQKTEGPPLLLMSLKAGGMGLTLTEADHVILMDPWWNPAVENQAIDRTHRIGQVNPVLVQRFIAKNTIEEKILRLQTKKSDLASSILTDSVDETGSLKDRSLTREDLIQLLSE